MRFLRFATCAGSALLLCAGAGPARGADARGPVGLARLQSKLSLDAPLLRPQSDLIYACFDTDSLLSLVNPACFLVEPQGTCTLSQPGDCIGNTSHFFVQAIRPDLDVRHRVLGFGFFSNDGETVFPSAGVVLKPVVEESFDLPTAAELANLQVRNVDTPEDLALVFVDLEAANLTMPAGTGFVVLVGLQFPAGELVDVGIGPGIVAEDELADNRCDFLTIDAGQRSDCWQEPAYIPGNPLAPPLDWGFFLYLERIVSVEDLTWTNFKLLYR